MPNLKTIPFFRKKEKMFFNISSDVKNNFWGGVLKEIIVFSFHC